MAVYFQLVRKGSSEPVVLQEVDQEMCKAFNVPCDPDLWLWSWYDCVGFKLAMGLSLDKIEHEYTTEHNNSLHAQHMLQVCRFIRDNFDPECWAGR